ncbi:MAG: aldehyde dehydrogenase family protein [Bacteroidia bacterium]
MDLFDKHAGLLEEALRAWKGRYFYSAFAEDISAYPAHELEKAKEYFENQLGAPFKRLELQGQRWLISDEKSPYTGEPLGISYPQFSPEELITRAQEALALWRWVSVRDRIGILLEAAAHLPEIFFEVALATQHTTGQAWMMSFQASGPHAADRALEALAVAYHELTHITEKVLWEKPAGKTMLRVEKRFYAMPLGITLHVGVSTFPVWNAMPGLFAALAVGSPVIVKPHPRAIYPIALVVSLLQRVLSEKGYPASLVQLAVDKQDDPITKVLAESPHVKCIDYTGGTAFGTYLESLPGKVTFLEKSGVNVVLMESVADLEAVAKNLAFSASLYSGQMCTAPQNVYIPEAGIRVGEKQVPYQQVVAAVQKAISDLATHPKAAPAILGAIQSPQTAQRIRNLEKQVSPLLASMSYTHPEFAQAQTLTPLVAEAAPSLAQEEFFGPRLLFIRVASWEEALSQVTKLAVQKGMLSCSVYTTNPDIQNQVIQHLVPLFVPVSFNYVGNVYVNQSAAFSDFHGSGGTPAANASYTDSAFIVKRFHWVQVRTNLG